MKKLAVGASILIAVLLFAVAVQRLADTAPRSDRGSAAPSHVSHDSGSESADTLRTTGLLEPTPPPVDLRSSDESTTELVDGVTPESEAAGGFEPVLLSSNHPQVLANLRERQIALRTYLAWIEGREPIPERRSIEGMLSSASMLAVQCIYDATGRSEPVGFPSDSEEQIAATLDFLGPFPPLEIRDRLHEYHVVMSGNCRYLISKGEFPEFDLMQRWSESEVEFGLDAELPRDEVARRVRSVLAIQVP